MTRTVPKQKPGKSTQTYCTPVELTRAIEKRFGKLQVDLAATSKNTRAPLYVSQDIDSLSLDWAAEFKNKILWLNPPYGHIAPWAEKCAKHSEAIYRSSGLLLFLTPASTGANWFIDHIYNCDNARVLFLKGRLQFGNHTTPYPKDCMITVFGDSHQKPKFQVWDWKAE